MNADMNARGALVVATLIGTALQLVMVVTGHFVPAVAAMFAIGGMAISGIAGFVYARRARTTRGGSIGGGALAGGLCALIGIAVSWLLGDVAAVILVFGTRSSAVTGAIGGWIGHAVGSRALARA